MKEYELIHECQYGVHYKRWVRVMARTEYCGVEVFIHRRDPKGWSAVTHKASGRRIAWGKVSAYPSAIRDFLDKELTPQQKTHLKWFSGRMVKAYQYSRLCGLPTYREAKPAIAAKREEIYQLEEIITGGGLPF